MLLASVFIFVCLSWQTSPKVFAPMFSYEERLGTFKHWPEKYRRDFAKRLAVMGQYSIDDKGLATACLYCSKRFEGWSLQDNPLLEHLSRSSGCTLFKLMYVSARREMSLKSGEYAPCKSKAAANQAISHLDEYFEKRFVQLNIKKDHNLFLCVRCGSSDLRHMCEGPVQKVSKNIDFDSAQFYIRYLNGSQLPQIHFYVDATVLIPNDKKEIFKYLMATCPDHKPLDTLQSFLERGSEVLFKELEKKMRKIEEDAVSAIFDDSVVL